MKQREDLEQITLDRVLQAMKTMDTSCPECAYYDGGSTCKAFPKGIPSNILSGQKTHIAPVSGDNGIQFAPKGKV